MVKKRTKKRGRKLKVKYWLTEEGLELLQSYVRDGYTDEEISKMIGINRTTFYEWQKKHSTIANAIKDTKIVANAKTENTAFKLANGFYFTEQQAIKVKDGNSERVEIVEIEKYMPPIPQANQFYLKNRMPHKWRDKQEVQVEGKVSIISEIISKIGGEKY